MTRGRKGEERKQGRIDKGLKVVRLKSGVRLKVILKLKMCRVRNLKIKVRN